MLSPARAVHLIVYGIHVPEWTAALGPGAPVWAEIPEVAGVTMVPAGCDPPPSPDEFPDGTVLIPLMEPHIRSRPRGFRELAPAIDAVDLLADKRAFSDYVRARGPALQRLVPRTYDRPEDATFPCLIKRTSLNGGNGIVLLRDRAHLEKILAAPAWRDVDYILQEFIACPTDYVTHAVYRDGTMIWHCSFAHAPAGNDPIRRGGRYQDSPLFHPPAKVLAQIERFMRPLGYNGPCCIDYKIKPDGDVCVLEINPRLGGSLMKPHNVSPLARLLRCIIGNATQAAKLELAAL